PAMQPCDLRGFTLERIPLHTSILFFPLHYFSTLINPYHTSTSSSFPIIIPLFSPPSLPKSLINPSLHHRLLILNFLLNTPTITNKHINTLKQQSFRNIRAHVLAPITVALALIP
ncbi:hypothetical protein, partial [Paenibacillus xylanexedens]|uniref:hypothetical protein n=1 Tax=Paenibacillus xylanexedens TaxID=528191 RepID=UPI001C92C459